ncbi:MAG TPA: alginate export family protein [Gammaproteobacteria bacterium]|nr:alginate export family protein [Gammaproteobacteria bacterium]
MRFDRVTTAAAAAALGAAAGAGHAAETLEQAVRESDFIFDLRARYEGVAQDGFTEDAEALTSRLRLGFQTAPLKKTSLLVEGVWVEALDDDYNSTTNGNTGYPVVADPADVAAINRAAIVNKSLPNATLTFGRQRIVLDDQRFVGNVGWRQNEQTFDAARAQLGGGKVKADLTYADQVNRVFGPDSPAGRWHGDVVLGNLGWTLPAGTLTLFDYFIDLDDAAAQSSNTLGARLNGAKKLGKIGVTYIVSYADQVDAGNNPASFGNDYRLLEGGLAFAKLGVGLGYEVLGSDGPTAFQTPLATLHAFEGWADKFLATPPAGIEDAYLKLSYAFGKRGAFTSINALAFFHDFAAEQSSAHYGDELDLQLVARTEKLAFTLKYADYRADELLTDTDKLWLSVDFAF